MKQLRTPKIREGELKIFWGRDGRRSAPEVMYGCGDGDTMRRDMRLLHDYVACQRSDPLAERPYSKMIPSLLEELDARGYDLSTLKFSIMKKDKL